MSTAVANLSDKQKALRSTGLGASEVPIALGLSPFQTAAELAAVKRGEMLPFEGNTYTKWGQRLEASIAENWLDEHREAGEDVSIFRPPTIRHPRCEYLLATADRIVVPQGKRGRESWRGALEVKNISAWRAKEFGEADDDMPEAFLVQTQAQLETLDLDEGWLVGLIGGNRYFEKAVRRDRDVGKELVEFAEGWWRKHVVEGLPVEIDGSEAAAAYLRRRFPRETAPLLEPTDAARELVQALRLAKAALKDAETAEAEVGHKLRALIGEAAGIAGLCTWKANKASEKTDFEAAISTLRQGVAFHGAPLPAAEVLRLIDEAIRSATITKPGARVLRLAKE